jgi:hypothetical protein
VTSDPDGQCAAENELRERLGADDDASAGTAFEDKFMDLMRLVIHHVADEETQLLPAAERLLADRLSDLGVEMTKRRIELLKPHAGELAATTMRSFPGQRRALFDYSKRSTGNPLGTDRGISLRRLSGLAR